MTAPANLPLPDLPQQDCWNRIGVRGDGSCPELVIHVHCHNCPVFAGAGQQLFEREPPADYAEQWTRQLAVEQSEATGTARAFLIFRMGEEWLALDVHALVEVSDPRIVRRLPHLSNRLLLGLVNIRGELQICISLRELLGIEATPQELAGPARPLERLLVAEYQHRWVFLVDEVAGVHLIAPGEVSNVPATVSHSVRKFSEGIFSWEDRRIGILSPERVFEALQRNVG
jgi:chemotaxis-related protein WspD